MVTGWRPIRIMREHKIRANKGDGRRALWSCVMLRIKVSWHKFWGSPTLSSETVVIVRLFRIIRQIWLSSTRTQTRERNCTRARFSDEEWEEWSLLNEGRYIGCDVALCSWGTSYDQLTGWLTDLTDCRPDRYVKLQDESERPFTQQW